MHKKSTETTQKRGTACDIIKKIDFRHYYKINIKQIKCSSLTPTHPAKKKKERRKTGNGGRVMESKSESTTDGLMQRLEKY